MTSPIPPARRFARLPQGHPALQTPAIWHPAPGVDREDFAVMLFRRTFDLPRAMKDGAIWVSASQRYDLLLDGRLISRGPSRSDPTRWGCVRVDLGPLQAGIHVLAARVTHFGSGAGIGQLGGPAFLLVAAEDRHLALHVNTSETWRCHHDLSREPLHETGWKGRGPYYVVGCGERIRGELACWDWEQTPLDDSNWSPAAVVCPAADEAWGNWPLGCDLRPDPLEPMERLAQRFVRAAEAPDDLRPGADAWVRGAGSLTIPPGREVRLVVDRGELTNAWPCLEVSGGRGASIRIISAEAPYEPDSKRLKAHRDQTAGKEFLGHLDEIFPCGGQRRRYETLWFRSMRYMELTIRTADDPLVLEDITCEFTGYPMRAQARFDAPGPQEERLKRFWDVSWRTARLCAHETFFDCPHYEQAQFPGDSRVQAVYHYLVCNDDTLARKAIDDFFASRLPTGLTQCRYPSRRLQVLPTFSLYWIGMMHDLLRYRVHDGFLTPYLPMAREVLEWFLVRRRCDGLLGRIEYAPFMDWTADFAQGNAPQDPQGGSSILTLLLAEACRWQADLETVAGEWLLAEGYRQRADHLVRDALAGCWDEERGLLADTASRISFSQHAQVQAVLAGAWTPEQGRAALTVAMDSLEVTPPGTHYYRYYVAQALKRCGMTDRFHPLLSRWDASLENTGLTTWPESDNTARSDCHAWSVTPAIEALETTLGICPAPGAWGMSLLSFSPCLGPLDAARGTVPTPRGPVRVELRRTVSGVSATVESPVPVLPEGASEPLQPGRHEIELWG